VAHLSNDFGNLEQGSREILRRRLAPLSPRALVWMAFAPEWPQQLLEANLASGGASEVVPLDLGLVEKAAKAGALRQSRAVRPWKGMTYRIAPELRQSAIDSLLDPSAIDNRNQPSGGLDFIRQELSTAGTAMLRAGGEKLKYAPGLDRWAQLASRAVDDKQLGEFLDRQVSDAIGQAEEEQAEEEGVIAASDKEGAIAAPDALRWIEAAEPFATLLKGTVETSLALARRRRELFFRRGSDIRRLRKYRRRPEQEAAFHELLADDDHWALHYVGSGGAGKTMLMAYIANRLAIPGKLAVARVDFDFLNPDYPARAPGMLLSAIAEELRLQAGESSFSLFAPFDNLLGSLNEWIATERQEHREPVITPDLPLFRMVIEAFARACLNLADRVVLILDTCEELAKLRPDGTTPENVRVTFEVFEAVRVLAPKLRVIFSGRRALAREGFGEWQASDCPLAARPYLRLCPVRSFAESEAAAFLSDFRHDGRAIPAELQKSILAVTQAPDLSADKFTLVGFGEPELRHNPYDVALFAEWAATDPLLDAEHLRQAGPHFYVQERIIHMLDGAVLKLLPTLAILGRFDRDLLTRLLDGVVQSKDLLEEVIQQEWIRPDRSGTGDKWLIDPALRDRILAYCEVRMPSELSASRESLAAMLRPVTLDRPWSELAEQYFAAMFEALRDRPEETAAWWIEVETRFAREAAWRSWAQQLTSFLLAQPALSSELDRSFRAAVLATQAAAVIHTLEGDAGPVWRNAKAAFAAYPAVAARDRLALRIECGLAAATGMPPGGYDPKEIDEQCCASILAAWEAAVERSEAEAEAEAEARPIGGIEVLERSESLHLRAFGLLLSARARMILNQPKEAAELFARAERCAAIAPIGIWLDWVPPENLLRRVQLEKVRWMPQTATPLFYSGALRNVSPSQSIDADRLWSALLQTVGPLGARGDLPQHSGAVVRPRCNAHRQFAPFDVVRSEIAARTNPADELAWLKSYSEAAKAARMPDVALEIDRAIARIVLRQRLVSEGWTLPATLQASTDREDLLLRAATRALHLSGRASELEIQAIRDFPQLLSRVLPWNRAERLMRDAEIAELRGDLAALDRMQAAEVAFREVGDQNGMLMAISCRALSLARRRQSVKPLAEQLEGLPLPAASWEEIRHGAHTGDLAFLASVEPAWRPWIVRVLAVKLVERDPELGSPAAKKLSKWLQATYAVDVQGGRHLPFELAFLEARSPPKQDADSWWIKALAVASLTTTAAALYLAAWFITESLAPDWGLLARAPTALVVLVAMLLGFGVVGQLLKKALVRFAKLPPFRSFISLQYKIELETRPSDLNQPLQCRWRTTTVSRILMFKYAEAANPLHEPTSETRYRALGPAVLVNRGAHLTEPYRMVRRLNVFIDSSFVTDMLAAAAPWEAVFGLPNTNFTRFEQHPFRFSRSIRPRKPLPQPDWVGSVRVTTWSYPGLGLDRADIHHATARSGKKRVISFETASNPAEYDLVRWHTGVARIFGNPIEASNDLFLSVGGLDRGESRYWVAGPDLKRRYPNLRLLVVQLPSADVSERTAADRLEAAQLRRFGAAAFQAGIPAVLVVPGIPRALVDMQTGAIYDLLRRGLSTGDFWRRGSRNSATQVLAMTRTLQLRIDALQHSNPDVPLELAFDVCLYLEDFVNLTIQGSDPDALPSPIAQLGGTA
jgi:hypothetical protein